MSKRGDSSDNFDMQLIGNFLSFASRGDRVCLNMMLREGISPNVQDYDKQTTLHLAASEGHASMAKNYARLYGHRDICGILEVNGGKDSINHHSMMVRPEEDSYEVNIDISELNLQYYTTTEQGRFGESDLFGESEKIKWRGTRVVKTVIKRQISQPVKMVLTATDNTILRELRHPNILQFLGSIVHGEEIILFTEYLSEGNELSARPQALPHSSQPFESKAKGTISLASSTIHQTT